VQIVSYLRMTVASRHVIVGRNKEGDESRSRQQTSWASPVGKVRHNRREPNRWSARCGFTVRKLCA